MPNLCPSTAGTSGSPVSRRRRTPFAQIIFELIERKPGMNFLPCCYVFHFKMDIGPKVFILAKGFRQVPGVEYTESYTPVVSLSVVLLFLCLVNFLDLNCDQMDVVTAFLKGDSGEEIFMEVPTASRIPNRPNLVCRFLKCLYGLEQSPRQWYAKIYQFLTCVLKFDMNVLEPCMYIFHNGYTVIIIILYMYDLLIAGNDSKERKRANKELIKHLHMKVLGTLREFIGICVTIDRARRILRLSQEDCVSNSL